MSVSCIGSCLRGCARRADKPFCSRNVCRYLHIFNFLLIELACAVNRNADFGNVRRHRIERHKDVIQIAVGGLSVFHIISNAIKRTQSLLQLSDIIGNVIIDALIIRPPFGSHLRGQFSSLNQNVFGSVCNVFHARRDSGLSQNVKRTSFIFRRVGRILIVSVESIVWRTSAGVISNSNINGFVSGCLTVPFIQRHNRLTCAVVVNLERSVGAIAGGVIAEIEFTAACIRNVGRVILIVVRIPHFDVARRDSASIDNAGNVGTNCHIINRLLTNRAVKRQPQLIQVVSRCIVSSVGVIDWTVSLFQRHIITDSFERHAGKVWINRVVNNVIIGAVLSLQRAIEFIEQFHAGNFAGNSRVIRIAHLRKHRFGEDIQLFDVIRLWVSGKRPVWSRIGNIAVSYTQSRVFASVVPVIERENRCSVLIVVHLHGGMITIERILVAKIIAWSVVSAAGVRNARRVILFIINSPELNIALWNRRSCRIEQGRLGFVIQIMNVSLLNVLIGINRNANARQIAGVCAKRRVAEIVLAQIQTIGNRFNWTQIQIGVVNRIRNSIDLKIRVVRNRKRIDVGIPHRFNLLICFKRLSGRQRNNANRERNGSHNAGNVRFHFVL